MKETMNWRYLERAGVMSRNEGGKEDELLVLMVFFRAKATFLSRVTVVREGMSVGEDRVMDNTLQCDGTRITECTTVPWSRE